MPLYDLYFNKQPRFRRWLTRLLERDEDCDVHMLGACFRINSIKEHGYLRASRLFAHSSLPRDEVPVLINLANLIQDGVTFVDIGANIGVYSLTLARFAKIHQGCSFHAFEANPDTFKRLQVHAATAGIHLHNVALSDRSGELEFVGGAVSHVFTTVPHANAYSIAQDRTWVPCCRLDEISLPGNSIVLKIDVEGQEKSVLDGAEELFRTGRVKAVYVDGYDDTTIEAFFLQHGFTLRNGKTLEPAVGHVDNLLALRTI